MPPKPKNPGWNQVQKSLLRGESADLIGLIKELYEASPENQLFLQSKLLGSADIESVLKPYRERIVRQFNMRRGDPRLDLKEARAAIREFKKATGSVAGTIELMLTYIEYGTSFAAEYGEATSTLFSSLTSVYEEMTDLLYGEGRELYPRFRERIQKLAEHSGSIGWGYGDFLSERAFELDGELLETSDEG